MPTFRAPVWSAPTQAYHLGIEPGFVSQSAVELASDSTGGVTFKDTDAVLNITTNAIHALIEEGTANQWFAKLPSHEMLIKRVRHTFSVLPTSVHNRASLASVWMTPKQVSFVWRPETIEVAPPLLSFEESESESEASDDSGEQTEPEPDIPESNLPPVTIRDPEQMSREEYLLSRLRAAKARAQAEELRLQYFESTGRMPPDSESDETDEEED